MWQCPPPSRSRNSSPPTNRTGQPSRHRPPTSRPLHAARGRHQCSSTAAPAGRAAGTAGYGVVTADGSSVFSAPSSSYSAAGGGHPWWLCGAHHPFAGAGTLSPAQPPIAHTWGRLWQGLPPLVPAQPSSSARQPNLIALGCSVRCTHTCSAPDGLADALPLLEFRPLPCSTCCTAHHTL